MKDCSTYSPFAASNHDQSCWEGLVITNQTIHYEGIKHTAEQDVMIPDEIWNQLLLYIGCLIICEFGCICLNIAHPTF